MQAATDRRSNDDDRVPLDALIELTHADGGEVLEADAVDVSSGGLSLRASFMPPLGARMQCSFSCPPHGDRVSADCEVVWSVLEGPQAGVFGVRFLALDTRSATLIRRLLEPDNPHVREVLDEASESVGAPATRRVLASLHIDGLGAPIEADVQVDEEDHVLLTQELDFLRLGRGVRVEIDGVVARRGRIASVKLEQTRGDTPALALGVLIDQPELATVTPMRRAPALPSEDAESSALDQAAPEVDTPPGATDTWPESPVFGGAPAQQEVEAGEAGCVEPELPASADAGAHALSVAAEAENPGSAELEQVEASATVAAKAFASSPNVPVPQPPEAGAPPPPDGVAEEEPETAATAASGLSARDYLGQLRTRAGELRAHVVGDLAERLPTWKTFWVELWAKLQLWFGSQLKRLDHFKRAHKKRRTTAPPPRKRTAAGRRAKGSVAAQAPSRGGRGRLVVVGLLAFAGVSAAVYALAPRPEDDAMLLHRAVGSAEPAEVAAPMQASAAPQAQAPVPQPVATPLAEPVAEAADDAADDASETTTDPRSFGAASVPNGRTYSLRMSAPIERIEGDKRRGGFDVVIPGRLSLDRAGAFATSHPALSRSAILNQGDKSVLSIDFAPGKQPAFRVEAKGSTLEITVERQ